MTITLVADNPLADGTYVNYAEVTQFEDGAGNVETDVDSDTDLGAGNDPNEIDDDISNGSADHDDLDPETVDVGQRYDVALQKSNGSPSQILPGEDVSYTITVTNQSTADVTDVVVTDTIPAGFSLAAISAGTWSGGAGATGNTTTTIAGPIAPGGTAQVTLVLTANNPLAAGTYVNYAEVTQFEDDMGVVQPDDDSDADLGAGNDPNEVDDDISNGPDHDDLDPGTVDIGDVYDVALQKTNATPAAILPGETVTFTITVTNQSTADVTDIVVTDTIPTGFRLDASSAGTWSGGAGATGSTTTTLAGPIAPGGTDTVTITLLADNPLSAGNYTNYAEVTQFEDAGGVIQADVDSNADLGAGNDPDEIDDDISNASPDHDDLDPETVAVGDVFDMALQKTNATPSSINPGEDVTFTITVTNQSTADVTDVVVTDSIPTGFSLSATSAGTWSGGAGATGDVTTTLTGPIAPGGTDTVTITLTADAPLAAANYTNYAEITQFEDIGGNVQNDADSNVDLGAGNDPDEIDDDISNGSPDHDDLDPEMVSVGQNYDVALQKTNATPSSILPGEDVTFTITVTNQSTADVTDVVITDTIPTGFSLSALSAGTWSGGAGATGDVTTTLTGPIAPGGTGVVTIRLTADNPLAAGNYTNYAEVTQFEDTGGNVVADSDSDADLGAGNDLNEIDDDISNASADHDDLDPETVAVGDVFDVALQKTNATPTSILAGQDVTFTITVTNQSTVDVANVVVSDFIPTGFSLAAASAGTWSGGAGATGTTTTTLAGPIAPGANASVLITLTADNPLTAGDYTNYAEVTQFEDTGGNVQTDADSDTDLGPGNDPNEVNDDISNGPDHDDLDPETVTVADEYDVALQKTGATPNPILPGMTVTFTITVTNQSTAPVTDVVISDFIPVRLQPRRLERRHLERRRWSHRFDDDDPRRSDRRGRQRQRHHHPARQQPARTG